MGKHSIFQNQSAPSKPPFFVFLALPRVVLFVLFGIQQLLKKYELQFHSVQI